jgi:hypothetical protein
LHAGTAKKTLPLLVFPCFYLSVRGECFSLHTRHLSSEQCSQEKQSLQGNFLVQADRFSGTYILPGIPGMETNGMGNPLSTNGFYETKVNRETTISSSPENSGASPQSPITIHAQSRIFCRHFFLTDFLPGYIS